MRLKITHRIEHCRTIGCGACCHAWCVREQRLHQAVRNLPWEKAHAIRMRFAQFVANDYAKVAERRCY